MATQQADQVPRPPIGSVSPGPSFYPVQTGKSGAGRAGQAGRSDRQVPVDRRPGRGRLPAHEPRGATRLPSAPSRDGVLGGLSPWAILSTPRRKPVGGGTPACMDPTEFTAVSST